jgi:hypothetical protein
MVRNKATALKVDKRPVILEHLPLTSLNMVVCPNKEDLNQPDRWLTSNRQPNMVVNRDTVAHHNSHQRVTEASHQWAMEDKLLPVLVDMGVVNKPPSHNGPSLLLLKALLEDTQDTSKVRGRYQHVPAMRYRKSPQAIGAQPPAGTPPSSSPKFSSDKVELSLY